MWSPLWIVLIFWITLIVPQITNSTSRHVCIYSRVNGESWHNELTDQLYCRELMNERVSDSFILFLCHAIFTQPHWKNKQRHFFNSPQTSSHTKVQKSLHKLSFYCTQSLYTISSVLPVHNHLLIYGMSLWQVLRRTAPRRPTEIQDTAAAVSRQRLNQNMKMNCRNTGEMTRRGEKAWKKR